jgi:hypothetical protein
MLYEITLDAFVNDWDAKLLHFPEDFAMKRTRKACPLPIERYILFQQNRGL